MPLAHAVGIVALRLDRGADDHVGSAAALRQHAAEGFSKPGVAVLEVRDILRPVDPGQVEDHVGLRRPVLKFRLGVAEVILEQPHVLRGRRYTARLRPMNPLAPVMRTVLMERGPGIVGSRLVGSSRAGDGPVLLPSRWRLPALGTAAHSVSSSSWMYGNSKSSSTTSSTSSRRVLCEW